MLLQSLFAPVLLAAASVPAPPPLTLVPSFLPGEVRAAGGDVLWGWSQEAVYRSTDAGASWQAVTPKVSGKVGRLTVASSGPAAALVVAAPQSTVDRGTGPVQLFRTSDGGAHWEAWKVPQNILRVFMDSPTRGTALGSPGDGGGGHSAYTVLRTVDGGRHWTQVNASAPGYLNFPEQRGGQLPQTGQVNGVRFLDARTGFLAGGMQLEARPYLYRTGDGGRHFTEIGHILPLTRAERGQLSSWWVPHARGREVRVWASFGTYRNGSLQHEHLTAFTSRDGGQHWTRTGSREAAPGTTLEAVALPDGLHGLTWDRPTANDGQAGRLHITADGGRTWQAVLAPFRRVLSVQLSLADARRGWALAWDRDRTHTLWRTRDGGLTWTALMTEGSR